MSFFRLSSYQHLIRQHSRIGRILLRILLVPLALTSLIAAAVMTTYFFLFILPVSWLTAQKPEENSTK